MKLKLFFFLLLCTQITISQNYQTIEEIDDACAQLGFSSNEEAEITVDKILDAVGLFRNFIIQECPDINNAVAKVIEISEGYKERYILYDNGFFNKIDNTAKTDWASISILAHEIGHHLNGHSLNNEGSNHKFELEADYFSGSALAKMGASLIEAQSAIATLRYEKATRTHPAKKDRLIAIENGWKKANHIKKVVVNTKENDNIIVFDLNKDLQEKNLKKGLDLYNLSQYISAAEHFVKAFQYSNGKETIYLYYAASAYVSEKNYDQALKYYLTILRTGIETLDAEKQNLVYKNIGLIYSIQNRNDEALKFFDFVLRKNPNDVIILQNKANVYYNSGDLVTFEKELKKIERITPENINVIYNLGVLSMEKKNINDAITYYKKALKINPEHKNSLLNISAAILSQELPIVEEMNNLGTTPAENKRYDKLTVKRIALYKEATVYLERYIAVDSSNIEVLNTTLNVYKTIGDQKNIKRIINLQNQQ
ncbi:tetratricopeptide repeat protein [Lacinutrix sp. C3R15]|uniref:tetratricopeptide repeat protein n=1 Tax=Flavobacteriaceae TaxID=49546 RepID=UPI001C09B103|nr:MULTISPECIES: tetratricopeptide repeat protein [Flavobacteriaceae]MBU2938560.1 tetratricopeptide repeat protein [Lacinutrix sp. C3R15]MDO6621874.1 tetratricopeptide repeat protein [Oceanihabitans sp. 1_MG-2023]